MVLSSIETIRRRRQGLPPLDFQTNIPKNIQNILPSQPPPQSYLPVHYTTRNPFFTLHTYTQSHTQPNALPSPHGVIESWTPGLGRSVGAVGNENIPKNIHNDPENIQNDPYKKQRLYLQPIVNLGCGFIAMSFIIFQFYLLANHI